jgi:hypothetical protein
MVDFSDAYFIKLGRKGSYEKRCIEEGIIRLGFVNPYHNECSNGNYNSLRDYFEGEKNKTKGVATSIINQIKLFYEADESILWITFYNKKLWWCHASSGIVEIGDGSRSRKAKEGWKSLDINGKVLSIDKLSGKLTKVQMYQGTICEVKEKKYLYEKINGILSDDIKLAQDCLDNLKNSLYSLVKRLTWKDFEILVDLIFNDAGWKRIGVLGKTEKDIDLDLLMPVTETRAFVQVKASSNQTEFDRYVEVFNENELYNEMYYVVHTQSTPINVSASYQNVHLIGLNKIVDFIINAGLINWLIEKAA